ncbi:CysS/YqeB C-terminal domain-containing protein [Streptomyces gobitricini]
MGPRGPVHRSGCWWVLCRGKRRWISRGWGELIGRTQSPPGVVGKGSPSNNDVQERREELARLGVVVRDEKRRQYWGTFRKPGPAVDEWRWDRLDRVPR